MVYVIHVLPTACEQAVGKTFRTFGVYICLSPLPWERKECEFGYPSGNQQRPTSGLVATLFL